MIDKDAPLPFHSQDLTKRRLGQYTISFQAKANAATEKALRMPARTYLEAHRRQVPLDQAYCYQRRYATLGMECIPKHGYYNSKLGPQRAALKSGCLGALAWLEKIVDAMDGIETFGVWENAEDGLNAIENGDPDVILMDISLPGMSGIEATIQVKDSHPDIDVIMLTVHDDDKKIFDALQAGASGYLLKNASPDDLCRAIFEVRAGGAPMSAEIARLVVEAFHRPASSEASQAFNLSKRETEIVQLVARGLANKEIAAELSISVETVRVHLKHIYEKLHVRSRTEAAMKYRDSLERAPWNK